MRRGVATLGHSERLAFAHSLLLVVPGDDYPPVPGADRVRTHGGRVAASLAGMFIELTAARSVSSPVKLSDQTLSLVLYQAAQGLNSEDLVSEDVAQYLAPRLVRHWRDGRFGIRGWRTYGPVCLWTMLAFRGLYFTESDRVAPAATSAVDEIEAYWDIETSNHADRKGRW